MLFRKSGRYDGPVVFADGVHYPAGRERQARHRLMWDAESETYAYWDGKGGSHQDRYHRRDIELELGEVGHE